MPLDSSATSRSWSLPRSVSSSTASTTERSGTREGVGEELQVLAHRDALVDARVVGHVADEAAHALGVER